jgi:hypothetical protein
LPCPVLPRPAVHICIFAFDLLYRDGASLLRLPLEERRRQLLQALPNMQPGRCQLAQSVQFPGALAAAADAAAAAAADEGGVGGGPAAGQPELQAPGSSSGAGAELAAADAAEQQLLPQSLEERLQEVLLEAFAAGAGAPCSGTASADARCFAFRLSTACHAQTSLTSPLGLAHHGCPAHQVPHLPYLASCRLQRA